MKTKSKFLVTLLLAVAFVFTVFTGVTLIDSAKADIGITSFETKYTSIRVDGKSGLRFQTLVKGSFDDTYSFGTLLLPEDMLGDDGELTHKDSKIVDVKQTVWDEESEPQKAFNAVLTDIPETLAGYNRKIVARGYYQVNGGDYVYATPLTRSTAQTAAMLEAQGKGNDFTAEILEVALPELTISASALDMVAGGKETLTVNTDLPVVWTSSKQDVATVANGVVTAVANGETVITATLGERTVECTVTVADYVQRDGSELVYTTANPTAQRYAKENATVSGRSGVYKYTTNSQDWTNKLAVKAGAHYESQGAEVYVSALNKFLTKGYKYVTIDVLMTKGSQMRISGLETSTTYVENKYNTGSDIVAAKTDVGLNDDIKLYNIGSTPVTATYADTWYTVVIDYSDIVLEEYWVAPKTYSMIMFGGIQGTIYFDNVRYYADGEKVNNYIASKTYAQYDGSEFVMFSSSPSTGFKFEQLTTETYGRTGVYNYFSDVGNWSNRMSIKQTNHTTTQFVGSTPVSAVKNMQALNYNYVTFEILNTAGGLVICAPNYKIENGTYTWVGQSNVKTWDASVASHPYITIYKSDDATKTPMNKGLSTKTWYTVVIRYDGDVNFSGANDQYHSIDICSLGANTNFYIDNVRYYSSNPLA